MQGNPFQTPSPLESDRPYAFSSQDPDSTPHIFGLSNPATAYKENKAVRLRHTPFNERCAFPVHPSKHLLAINI